MPKKVIFNPTTGELDFVSEEDLSGYVPYTDATSDVDLGDNALIVDKDGSTGLMKHTTTTGVISYVEDNSSNWNTAYSWGNHANYGYLTDRNWDHEWGVSCDATQSIPDNTWTIIQYNQLQYDTMPDWGIYTQHSYVAKNEEEVWDVSARIQMGVLTEEMRAARNGILTIAVFVNGSEVKRGEIKSITTVNMDYNEDDESNAVIFSGDILLKKDDVMDIRVCHRGSGAYWDTIADGQLTWATAHKFRDKII